MTLDQTYFSSEMTPSPQLREWGPPLDQEVDESVSRRDLDLPVAYSGMVSRKGAAGVVAYRRRASTDCSGCPARKDGLCAGLSDDILHDLRDHKAGDRNVGAGEDLFGPGAPCDAIYNLVNGWLVLYNILEDGSRHILHFALPGAMLGFIPGFGAMTTYGVQALTDSTVCVIPHRTLTGHARKHPEIGMRLAWLISRDRSLAFDHLTSIGRQPARQRVARLLLELFIRYRAQWPENRIEEMYLPLTQEHIGDATGLTNVHVNRVLRDLRQSRLLEFSYRRLKILDPDKLIDVAGIDPAVAMSWIRRPPCR